MPNPVQHHNDCKNTVICKRVIVEFVTQLAADHKESEQVDSLDVEAEQPIAVDQFWGIFPDDSKGIPLFKHLLPSGRLHFDSPRAALSKSGGPPSSAASSWSSSEMSSNPLNRTGRQLHSLTHCFQG